MHVSLREVTAADVAECGQVCFEAFSVAARRHGFPVDWKGADAAARVIGARVAQRRTYGVVAEARGGIVGSAFLKSCGPVGAIGPVTVAPQVQGLGVGRRMMEHLLERAREEGLAGTRLVQAAYTGESLALYLKLGFEVREFVICVYGGPIEGRVKGRAARRGRAEDVGECNALCMQLLGHARREEIEEAVELGFLDVVEREGRIAGYTTGMHLRGHTVAEEDEDAEALLSVADEFHEPGVLLPAKRGELVRWALGQGMRIVQPLTLMARGYYEEPRGVFMPSIHA